MKLNELIRGPYDIKINGETLSDVISIGYKDRKLSLEFYPTNYEQANDLLDGKEIKTVCMIGCSKNGGKNTAITYFISNRKDSKSMALYTDGTVVRMEMILDVCMTRIGIHKEAPKSKVQWTIRYCDNVSKSAENLSNRINNAPKYKYA